MKTEAVLRKVQYDFPADGTIVVGLSGVICAMLMSNASWPIFPAAGAEKKRQRRTVMRRRGRTADWEPAVKRRMKKRTTKRTLTGSRRLSCKWCEDRGEGHYRKES